MKLGRKLLWLFLFLIVGGTAAGIFLMMQSSHGELSWKTHDQDKIEEMTEADQEEYQSAKRFGRLYFDADGNLIEEKGTVPRPDIDEQLLTKNKYSRPGKKVKEVKYLVIHYLGNPGTTAQENRDYFESLKDLKDVSMSSNYIVGLDGEIIQCVPDNEVAYASNSANKESISIENCNMDQTGKFLKDTYISLVKLTAYLAEEYNLDRTQIIRHHDITGKSCPIFYVENEEAWELFLDDVMHYRFLCYKNSPDLLNLEKTLKGIQFTYTSKDDKSIVKAHKIAEESSRPLDYEDAYDEEDGYYDDEYYDDEYYDDEYYGDEYYEEEGSSEGNYEEYFSDQYYRDDEYIPPAPEYEYSQEDVADNNQGAGEVTAPEVPDTAPDPGYNVPEEVAAPEQEPEPEEAAVFDDGDIVVAG